MRTFIKAKLKKSDGQTNVDTYKVAALKISHDIISESKIFTYYVFKKPKKWILNMKIHFLK